MFNPLKEKAKFASHSEVALDFRGTNMFFIEMNCADKRIVYKYSLSTIILGKWKMEKKLILSFVFLFKRNSQLNWKDIHRQENKERKEGRLNLMYQ